MDCDPYYNAEALRRSFDGVEELEVEVFRSSWGIGGYESLDGFAGIRGVKRAKVRGSVGHRFARWLEEAMQTRKGLGIVLFQGVEDRDGERYLDR